MLATSRFLGYRRVGRNFRGYCSHVLVRQDVKWREASKEHDAPGMDEESRRWITVNGICPVLDHVNARRKPKLYDKAWLGQYFQRSSNITSWISTNFPPWRLLDVSGGWVLTATTLVKLSYAPGRFFHAALNKVNKIQNNHFVQRFLPLYPSVSE